MLCAFLVSSEIRVSLLWEMKFLGRGLKQLSSLWTSLFFRQIRKVQRKLLPAFTVFSGALSSKLSIDQSDIFGDGMSKYFKVIQF